MHVDLQGRHAGQRPPLHPGRYRGASVPHRPRAVRGGRAGRRGAAGAVSGRRGLYRAAQDVPGRQGRRPRLYLPVLRRRRDPYHHPAGGHRRRLSAAVSGQGVLQRVRGRADLLPCQRPALDVPSEGGGQQGARDGPEGRRQAGHHRRLRPDGPRLRGSRHGDGAAPVEDRHHGYQRSQSPACAGGSEAAERRGAARST